jgi:hypothetical protein
MQFSDYEMEEEIVPLVQSAPKRVTPGSEFICNGSGMKDSQSSSVQKKIGRNSRNA